MNKVTQSTILAISLAFAPVAANADAPNTKPVTVKDKTALKEAARRWVAPAPTGVAADPTVKATTDATKTAGTAVATGEVKKRTGFGGFLQSVPIVGPAANSVGDRVATGTKNLLADGEKGVSVLVNEAVAESLKGGVPAVVFYGSAKESEALAAKITVIPGVHANILIVDPATLVGGKKNGDVEDAVKKIVEAAGKGTPVIMVFKGDPKTPVLTQNAFAVTPEELTKALTVAVPPAPAAPGSTNPPVVPANTNAPVTVPPAAPTGLKVAPGAPNRAAAAALPAAPAVPAGVPKPPGL